MKTYVFYIEDFNLEHAEFDTLADAKVFVERMMSEDKYLTPERIKIVSNGELQVFEVEETVTVRLKMISSEE